MGFNELCDTGHSLQLDHYQRPFVWSRRKVLQLLDDLAQFHLGGTEQAYYLGTLLLHRDEKRSIRFVIDGQQRLSSLAVLYFALSRRLPEQLQFEYRSPLSAANLREAQRAVAELAPLRFDFSIFERLRFTVISVASEDLAFTFFDTQNNRGVPLKATDLLKAYHLRAVNSADIDQSEQFQQQCARRWEAIQVSGPQKQDKRGDFAPDLFSRFLWRARNWRGQKRIEREDHDGLLETFQQQSVKADAVDSLPLYPGHSNQLAARLCLQSAGGHRLDLNPVQVSGNAARLPFSLRQPIHEGVGFFLYAQKFAALLDELFHQPSSVAEISALRTFHQQVVEANSHYLRELFNVALLMYVDRFGHLRLLEFAHLLELILGAIRLEKQYIFKEAPLKYLKESEFNLLDVIAGAYRPDEVLAFLQADLGRSKGYGDNFRKNITAGEGVQGRYLAALQAYFRVVGLPAGAPTRFNILPSGDTKESIHA
jgi:hypothetical protein